MNQNDKLYPSFYNPYLIRPTRPLPGEIAVIGAGSIGPDIAYFLRTGLPEKKLYLVDVLEEPLKNAEKRFEAYAKKGVDKRKLTPDQAKAVLSNVVYTTDYDAIKNCGLVIEAATHLQVNAQGKGLKAQHAHRTEIRKCVLHNKCQPSSNSRASVCWHSSVLYSVKWTFNSV